MEQAVSLCTEADRYFYGSHGLIKNHSRAFELYEAASSHGLLTLPCFSDFIIILQICTGFSFFGSHVPRWYINWEDLHIKLIFRLDLGLGISVNIPRAIELFLQASEAGSFFI